MIRIQLDAEQSAQLTQAGGRAFSIVGRASHPSEPSLWILSLAPLDWAKAIAATSVLVGTHRAVKITKKEK